MKQTWNVLNYYQAFWIGFFSFRCIMQFFIRKMNITSLDYRTLYALDLVVSLSCLMHQKCFDPSGLGCLEKLEIDISWRIRDLVLHSAGRSESPDLLEPISAKKKQIRNLLPLYYSLLDRFHSLSIKWLLKAIWSASGSLTVSVVGCWLFRVSLNLHFYNYYKMYCSADLLITIGIAS